MSVDRVLLVEDDGDQRQAVEMSIRSVFQGSEILSYPSAYSVLSALENQELPRCQLAVVDRMLTWCTVDEIVDGGVDVNSVPTPRHRGLLVANRLVESNVPPRWIVFLTVLSEGEEVRVPGATVLYVRKDSTLDHFEAALSTIHRAERA